MKVTVIAIIVCSSRTVLKGKKIGRVVNHRTNQDHPNVSEETCCYSGSREKPSAYARVKNYQEIRMVGEKETYKY